MPITQLLLIDEIQKLEEIKLNASIIACKTLENEINKAVEALGIDYPVYWIDSGLHNYPEKLKEQLQENIDQIKTSDYIIMLFGLCGNALLGISSKTSTLVIPKVDDCISMFLGGNEQRRKLENDYKAYYLTKGWLTYENNIWNEYQHSIEKYGRERTRSLFQIMLKHYTHLVVIDTGAYDTESFLKETKKIADELNLTHKLIPGDLALLYRALEGKWDHNFALIEPGQKISMQNMGKCESMGIHTPNW